MVYKTDPNSRGARQFSANSHATHQASSQDRPDHLAKGPGGFGNSGFGNSGMVQPPFQAVQSLDESTASLSSYQGPEPVYARGLNLAAAESPLYANQANSTGISDGAAGGSSGGSWRVTTCVAAGVLLAVGLGLTFAQKDAVVLADAPLIMPGELDERVRPEMAGGMFIPDRNMSIMNGNIQPESLPGSLDDASLQANLDLLKEADQLDDNILVPTPVSFHPDPAQSDDATIGDLLNQLKQGDAWTEGRLLQRRLGLNLASMLKDDTPDPFAEADRELSSRIQAPAAIVEAAKNAAIEEERLANLAEATLLNDFLPEDLSIDMEVASLIPDTEVIIPQMLAAPAENLITGGQMRSASAQAHTSSDVPPASSSTLALPSFGRSANIEPTINATVTRETYANARVAPNAETEVVAKVEQSLKFENKSKLSFNFVSEVAYAEPTIAPDETFSNFASNGSFDPTRMVFFGQTAQVSPAAIPFEGDLALGSSDDEPLLDPFMQFAAAGETNFVPSDADMLDDAFIDQLNDGVEVAQLSLDGQGVQPIFDGNAPLPPLVEEVEAEIDRMNQGLSQQNNQQLQQQQMQQQQMQQMNGQQQAALEQARADAASNAAPLDSPFGDAPISHRPQVPEGLTSAAVGTPYAIQLASVRSQAKAEATWQRVQRKFPELLGDMVMGVETAKVKGKTYYRVQAGPIPNKMTGVDVCSTLKANRQDCIVKKRK